MHLYQSLYINVTSAKTTANSRGQRKLIKINLFQLDANICPPFFKYLSRLPLADNKINPTIKSPVLEKRPALILTYFLTDGAGFFSLFFEKRAVDPADKDALNMPRSEIAHPVVVGSLLYTFIFLHVCVISNQITFGGLYVFVIKMWRCISNSPCRIGRSSMCKLTVLLGWNARGLIKFHAGNCGF